MSGSDRTVASFDPDEFESRLGGPGLGVRFGPFDMHLRIRVPALAATLYPLYRDYPVLDGARVYSCHFVMQRVRNWRNPRSSKVRVLVDGRPAHEDMPLAHALPVLEWGLNLVIAMRYQTYLMLHSAVVERNGAALLLPASPGHGKTTLCAALANRGWRFLSDEFGLVRPGATAAEPVPRLMPLKNESIAVLREFAPEAYIGPEVAGTRKGTVAHLRPPSESVAMANRASPVKWIVFPRWSAGAGLDLASVPKAQAFMELATHAFNYEPLGFEGFETVKSLIDAASCWRLSYSRLDEAVEALAALADHSGN